MNKVNQRVRAIITVASKGILLIERTKHGTPVYHVFPGGGVESDDASREAALLRELREELGLTPKNLQFAGRIDKGQTTPPLEELFYYVFCDKFDGAFVGEERQESRRGQYRIIFVSAPEQISHLNILPSEAVPWLRNALSDFNTGK